MKFSWLTSKIMIVRAEMKARSVLRLRPSKKVSRRWYNLLSRLAQEVFADFTCMNYGFFDPSFTREHKLDLEPADQTEAHSLALYHYTASGAGRLELSHQAVLEVGCGRGGGASFVARYLKPDKMIGIDLSSAAIQFCRRAHRAPNLDYQVGDAEALPFPDAHFDVVINLESSHCYPKFTTFIREVWRVLRPGGHLLISDFRYADQVDLFGEELRNSDFIVIASEDITDRVVAALRLDSSRRQALIDDSSASVLFRPTLRHFAGCIGSPMYEDFVNRRRVYHSYILQKPER